MPPQPSFLEPFLVVVFALCCCLSCSLSSILFPLSPTARRLLPFPTRSPNSPRAFEAPSHPKHSPNSEWARNNPALQVREDKHQVSKWGACG